MSDEPAPGSTSACPHPEEIGKRWGDPISDERQAELQGILDAWNAPDAEHGERQGPFDNGPRQWSGGVRLSGAEVFWLAERVRSPDIGFPGPVPTLHLEGTDLSYTHLETLYVNSCAGTMSVSPELGVPLRREAIGMSIPRPTSVHTYPATTPRL
jgi:hypothetical protein